MPAESPSTRLASAPAATRTSLAVSAPPRPWRPLRQTRGTGVPDTELRREFFEEREQQVGQREVTL